MVDIREHLSLRREITDFIISDAVLTVSMAMLVVDGLSGLAIVPSAFLYYLPIAFIAVSLSFILHELMHKLVAQRFGAIAAFRKSTFGIIITLATALFGFLIGIPGATVIYTSNFSRREEGIVSLAGPLTNLAIFLAFFLAGNALFAGFNGNVLTTLNLFQAGSLSYLHNIINFTVFVSILLGFFNMLPIFPLDGSKVFRWNKPVYFAVLVVIFALMLLVVPLYTLILSFVFMLAIALFFSFAYRGISI